jgi:hypothetical protein
MITKKKDNKPIMEWYNIDVYEYEKKILQKHSIIDENVFLSEYCDSSVVDNCLLQLLSHKIIFSDETINKIITKYKTYSRYIKEILETIKLSGYSFTKENYINLFKQKQNFYSQIILSDLQLDDELFNLITEKNIFYDEITTWILSNAQPKYKCDYEIISLIYYKEYAKIEKLQKAKSYILSDLHLNYYLYNIDISHYNKKLEELFRFHKTKINYTSTIIMLNKLLQQKLTPAFAKNAILRIINFYFYDNVVIINKKNKIYTECPIPLTFDESKEKFLYNNYITKTYPKIDENAFLSEYKLSYVGTNLLIELLNHKIIFSEETISKIIDCSADEISHENYTKLNEILCAIQATGYVLSKNNYIHLFSLKNIEVHQDLLSKIKIDDDIFELMIENNMFNYKNLLECDIDKKYANDIKIIEHFNNFTKSITTLKKISHQLTTKCLKYYMIHCYPEFSTSKHQIIKQMFHDKNIKIDLRTIMILLRNLTKKRITPAYGREYLFSILEFCDGWKGTNAIKAIGNIEKSFFCS